MTLVPQFSRPPKNRQVLLVKRPAGIPQKDDFLLTEAAIPVLGEGQFLVRNIYLSVDPAQRGWANAAANYAAPVPLGTPMRALGVGEIIDSRNSAYRAGHYVYGWLGWQDYAVIGPSLVLTYITVPEIPLSTYAGILGINGLTAHIALTSVGRPQAGETVLVSTAAGAVGATVGQIAKSLGCKTVGLTGDDSKVAQCTGRFGYDAAINYKTAGLGAAIAAAAPKGIDVFFDNAGGDILDTAIRHMRPGGRIVQCGTASISNWLPAPQGLRNEREVMTRRLCWSGFVIFDHIAGFEAAIAALIEKIRAGALVYEEDVAPGIEAAPDSLRQVYAGENRGKKLIFVG